MALIVAESPKQAPSQLMIACGYSFSAKPVRRSKSQRNSLSHQQQNFVTSIQHGGSVTLVSLNGDSNNSNSESEVKHVHHHHFVQGNQTWDYPGSYQGLSHTLPRKGSKKVEVKPTAHDDSDVVIKKQGLNGVKIRLNLNQLEHEKDPTTSSTHSPESSLDFHYNNKKRKYTLEELEIEGFATPTEESNSSGKTSDFEEEVDLNSLIEGDVDEDDDDMPTPLGKTILDGTPYACVTYESHVEIT